MTVILERLTEEVRRLTPPEMEELRAWIMGYQPAHSGEAASRHVDWSGHAASVQAIFGVTMPVRENAVLALREEERF